MQIWQIFPTCEGSPFTLLEPRRRLWREIENVWNKFNSYLTTHPPSGGIKSVTIIPDYKFNHSDTILISDTMRWFRIQIFRLFLNRTTLFNWTAWRKSAADAEWRKYLGRSWQIYGFLRCVDGRASQTAVSHSDMNACVPFPERFPQFQQIFKSEKVNVWIQGGNGNPPVIKYLCTTVVALEIRVLILCVGQG